MMVLRLLLAVTLSLSAVALHATPAINLWQAWQLALQHDPIYAAQRANTQANQELINQARAKLLPAIDAVGSTHYNDHRRASKLNQSQSDSVNQWQLRLNQPLLDLSAMAQLERSRYLAAIAVFDLENAKNDLLLRLSQAYFDVLSAKDSLVSLHAQHRAIEHQLQAAELNFELGGATITDTYEAQSRLDLLRAQLLATEKLWQQRLSALSRILGQSVQDLAPLRPNAVLPAPDPLNPDAWVRQSQLNNLFVAKSNLAIQAQQYQLKAEQREHAPTIALQARSGSQSNQGIYGVNTSPRALDSSIGIELSIPIYQGGGISSKVRENASLLQQKHYELENARRQAQENTEQFFTGVTTGLLEVKALEAAEVSSAASVEANQTAYSLGARVNMDVLNAQQQLYETQRALARSRYDTILAGLSLKNAAGLLQDSDVEAINQLLEP